jgi:hypothetical protein
MSSQVTNHQQKHFVLCKEQQHSQKLELFVSMVLLKLLRGSKPAGLTVCIFFSLFVRFVSHDLTHEHFERRNERTFFLAYVPTRLDYIDTTTR